MNSARSYSLATGAADTVRLRLLGDHYDPASRALLDSTGVRAGDWVADIGCGHGAMTAWLAERVGDGGKVYAVDSAAEQLEIARRELDRHSNTHFVCAPIEEEPLPAGQLDIVYSRFLVLHLPDPLAAVRAMVRMLKPTGRLVIEVADIGSLRFVPGGDDAELWLKWWRALGRARQASYDVAEGFSDLLLTAGLRIERMDVFQPVSFRRDAKQLHALGFRQLIPDYIARAGASPADIERHLAFLDSVLDDPGARVELYRTTHYVATPSQQG
jgi:SAM-dependent methyltransferase